MKKTIVICVAMIVGMGTAGCSTAVDKYKTVTVQRTELPAQQENASEASVQGEKASHSPSYDAISNYMEAESKKAFSAHYELIGFELSDYQEKTAEGKVEATFSYQIRYKNFAKDPDTVAYIKTAKETGDPHYQQLHDEYLQPKEMNFQLKAVLEGADSVTLYTNASQKGTQWEKATMSDFLLSN